MARANLFVIQELDPRLGTPFQGAERFEWSSKKRNIPLQPWSFGVTQRHARTDYPGADDPTIQVLGPNFTPFTLTGRWDDRYNPQTSIPTVNSLGRDRSGRPSTPQIVQAARGYAVSEWKRFETMVRRGNPIRITFEDITVMGIISGCSFDYQRSWDIGYSFTVEPLHRAPRGFFSLRRSPRAVLNAQQLRDEVNVEVESLEAYHADAPQLRLTGSLFSVADAAVTNMRAQVEVIDAAIDQRNVSLEREANTALLRLGAAFSELSTISATIIALLDELDSSEALDFEDQAVPVLDYDVWARGLMSQSRQIVVKGERAASEVAQRAEPNAIALYRPLEGEHLYSVSNRFYKTPHNWRSIYERNGLLSTSLTGEELLIIPEVTGR